MFSVTRVVDKVIKQQNATRGYVLVQKCQCLNSACRITALSVAMIMPVTLQHASGAVLFVHAIKHSCHRSLTNIVLANGLIVCVDANTFCDTLRWACAVTIAYPDTDHSLCEGR